MKFSSVERLNFLVSLRLVVVVVVACNTAAHLAGLSAISGKGLVLTWMSFISRGPHRNECVFNLA